MNYKYTITETHTNSKTDPSSVILHDAYTDEPVWQDGSDIVFFLENGIVIRPYAEPNSTNRYLQTDGAEVRLRNVIKITVRNGKSFPCVGEQFIILHHRYRPDAGIFQMQLINNQHHGELYFDFTCNSVEYRFNEFKEDSWIQRARNQEQEIVRCFLRQGRGEAVHMLRRLDDADRHEYHDSVRYAVTHDLRFDHQCEPKRTQYIFDLLESYQGEDRVTLDRAILYDCRKKAAKSYDMFALDQYLDVLKRFAESGESAAEEAIRQIYETIRTAYETRTEIPKAYDELADRYRLISRFIGKPLPDDDEAYPVQRPKTHREDPPITMQSVIEATRNPKGRILHPRRFHWYFQENVTPADLVYLAETAKNEPDPAVKARLYSLFSEADYPGDPAELIALAREHEPMLHSSYGQPHITAFKLQHALSRLRNPAVRAYGFDLIERALAEEDSKRFVYGFEHWTANYDESADLDQFCDLLTGLPKLFDADTRHSLEYAIIHRMFNRRYDDPCTYGHLVWVYENTCCSCCRRKAVEILAMHGMLQKRIREQCRFDCDPHTRKIAENAEEYRELYASQIHNP
ncbi:MAG: hypothetical protein J6I42_14575 [Clostridia bacterium]|nr:hypothetical protein [Clostridia bacterium]